ncbi:MAG TPA: putative LPS assembly protein LptD, partial [Bryobacteraceae bacterium]|nr:putative LPS assembly protein LptD [Bryobacteraceae bacterium]
MAVRLSAVAAWAVVAQSQSARPPGVAAPRPDEVLIWAASKTAEGPVYHLRGSASLETTELQLWADEMDYNEETGEAEARGNVHFQHFQRGEELWATRAEYNLRHSAGRFYDVRGTSPPKIERRPGLLTSPRPFYFEGRWAERLKERYILHDGFVTNCRLPKPWWAFRASRFDIVPGEHATARGATFRLRSVPLLYAPIFYKSLEEQPRQSGFLTPNAGNSSRRGKMAGLGYYWAINRSYDATYRAQWFTQRGFAHHVDFRGKPTQNSEFNYILYGVNDKGEKLDSGERRKEGGFIMSGSGKASLGRGFEARLEGNYLSTMRFRRAFTESFNEAILAEVHSVGYVDK